MFLTSSQEAVIERAECINPTNLPPLAPVNEEFCPEINPGLSRFPLGPSEDGDPEIPRSVHLFTEDCLGIDPGLVVGHFSRATSAEVIKRPSATLPQTFNSKCGLCGKLCKSQGGLSNHERACRKKIPFNFDSLVQDKQPNSLLVASEAREQLPGSNQFASLSGPEIIISDPEPAPP